MAQANRDRRRPSLDARFTARFGEAELAAMSAAIAPAIDSGPAGRSAELAELRTEVNHVGVNLNQVVREFNAGRLSGRDFREHEDLMAALGEVASVMRDVREHLGGRSR
ncbi:hypothetical protein CFAL_07895 [Corynebacterium falsenii DSM 44353]|uniref:hypothetical protein n=1 Tax=Corynebacterium falsenii TaxID=108486 RepID=UPI0003E928D6|nr:hypothetical protein [Corynebacterium falsenii]AHI04316.1 hypothetical protein CFAL_07895 [Corynebacterium falsenii DSM 44353]UBI04247.1 hypothetical protein LA343_09765 [Corynebacterium falsenii]